MTNTAHPIETAQDYLTFFVGEVPFGIEIERVREIRSWIAPTPLPRTPPHISGVINLRGLVLPVLDLGRRLDLPDIAHDARSVFIVVDLTDQLMGLLVSGVSDILPVAPDQVLPPPAVASADGPSPIKALIQHDHALIRVLDIDHLAARAALPEGAS